MKRLTIEPRRNWQARIEQVGLVYHSVEGRPYWDESACYQFVAPEIDILEAATEELQKLCLSAGQSIIDNDLFAELDVPEFARQAVRDAWEQEPPSLYGRFDLAYDGLNPPKLLEYNADTPTGLLEASIIQWHWQSEVFAGADQFNSIHEKLVAKWTDLKGYLAPGPLYFACMQNDEDLMTVTYLRDTAQQAGIKTTQLFVRELGWQNADRTFRDLQERRIGSIFKLYPWEWLLEDCPEKVLGTLSRMQWIEPIWKMMWSNKGLLAILWRMFPDHPNLLPAYLDGPREMSNYVRKPLLSREGANVTICQDGRCMSTDGPYGEGRFVYQQVAPGWSAERATPVIGSWYITDQGPAGIGVREGVGIVNNTSRFVPHVFR